MPHLNLPKIFPLLVSLSVLSICAMVPDCLFAQRNSDSDMPRQPHESWEQIAPFFSPPAAYKNQYGEYRSPLLFEDGKRVRNKRAWEKRRVEIRDKWHGLMGTWPEINQLPAFEILETIEKEGFWQKKIAFDWVPGQRTTGYLLIPFGASKYPAVITVYYEPETAAGLGRPDLPDRDFALQLTQRGFVTLSLGTTESTLNQTYSIYYPSIDEAQVEPLSMLAYAAATSWHVLAQQPEVDPDRIGIMGHSYGGKWAMFASCLYDKFVAAAWSDPGIVFQQDRPSINYWEPWYLGYHPPPWRKRGMPEADNPAVGLYPILLEKGLDLHELHALMAPRPFLVSGGSEDPVERWIPLNHSVEVNKLLGYTHRVGMTNRSDHAPNAASNAVIVDFFSYFLLLESHTR
ncbi:MAG: prolyl oligopeptidase family serine peptidase [Lunatimonas sp.]|nr:prolyl oligopeptidase family serine peptidase [Lunatimonas sp.]